jgi:hypothetical protein
MCIRKKYIFLLMFVMSLSVVQWLSCLPLDSRFGMFMDGYGAIVECWLTRKIEEIEESLLQYHFVHYDNVPWDWTPAVKRQDFRLLNYGTILLCEKYTKITPNFYSVTNSVSVAVGGVMVSVLASGPRVRGFKPGRGRWIFKGDKSL